MSATSTRPVSCLFELTALSLVSCLSTLVRPWTPPLVATVSFVTASSTGADVFLLGAGFSHAISTAMPVMSGLGTAVAARFGQHRSLRNLLAPAELRVVDDGKVPLGNVEVWLSSLATEQPFLPASRNLQRKALFAELASQISDEIESRRSETTSVTTRSFQQAGSGRRCRTSYSSSTTGERHPVRPQRVSL